jgi:steroid 5-alpha reductase family enzyme
VSLAALILTALATSLGAMIVLWGLSLALRDASIVDIWWGPGFALIAGVTYALSPEGNTLATVLTMIWGLRLGAYLLVRNAGHGEDPRYQAMRRHHGERFPVVSLLTVFGLQGVLMWLVSMPVQVANHGGGGGAGLTAALGFGLWAVGLFFEAVGDLQLARFKADPESQGRVMDRGLWRYTRHPNYFGDACAWWGIWLVCLGAPGAAWTVLSPALMTFFLLRISGVALLERSIGKRRPEYAEYQRRTSAFFPLPPRR